MKKNPTLLVVAAGLVASDGRLLLQQRPAGRSMAGLWEFPGGKVEEGETPEAALVRELAEELDIAVEPEWLSPACFASTPLGDRHLLLLLYLCRRWQGELRPIEAAGLQWLRVVEMRGLDMPPADRPLLALLESLL